MCGSRKAEIMLRTVANFTRERSVREGYLVQWGVAKERGHDVEEEEQKDDDEEEDQKVDADSINWALRRRVEKPILRVIRDPTKSPTDLFTVDDILEAIEYIRQSWQIDKLIKAGQTIAQIASSHDKELLQEVRESFPDAAAYSVAWRKNQIGSHFLRKLYANYSYDTLGNPATDTFGSWSAQYLGWKPSSALLTSHHYHDVFIIRLPRKLPEMQEVPLSLLPSVPFTFTHPSPP
jgi:hypothetical protein